jgi:hypothetical protein
VTARDSIVVRGERSDIFELLCDPACIVQWVVGANRLREVDDDWPAVGSRFHHAVGMRLFELHDVTEMCRCEAPALIELHAKVRPFFEARVQLRLEDLDGATRVTMIERPTGGLFKASALIGRPALSLRNRISLHRFAALAASAGCGARSRG